MSNEVALQRPRHEVQSKEGWSGRRAQHEEGRWEGEKWSMYTQYGQSS